MLAAGCACTAGAGLLGRLGLRSPYLLGLSPGSAKDVTVDQYGARIEIVLLLRICGGGIPRRNGVRAVAV
ncbi:hypothetical protein MANAM107_09550 [Actinomyces capricornis]|uniref:Uncharacterized protein n=1 Tax=Actinomyces capricornis TaxID=2755559 RepID=A0ABM7U9U6_9ACTO|nr:hypothetical protein MANAM107_09550 [Actinomyces capricornis]